MLLFSLLFYCCFQAGDKAIRDMVTVFGIVFSLLFYFFRIVVLLLFHCCFIVVSRLGTKPWGTWPRCLVSRKISGYVNCYFIVFFIVYSHCCFIVVSLLFYCCFQAGDNGMRNMATLFGIEEDQMRLWLCLLFSHCCFYYFRIVVLLLFHCCFIVVSRPGITAWGTWPRCFVLRKIRCSSGYVYCFLIVVLLFLHCCIIVDLLLFYCCFQAGDEGLRNMATLFVTEEDQMCLWLCSLFSHCCFVIFALLFYCCFIVVWLLFPGRG